MIKKPSNWDSVQAFSDRRKLPLDAYICRIKQAKVVATDYGEQLCILFDIDEGDYTGFFADDYANNNRDDKKWKGVLRQWLPKDDGSDKDEWAKSSLKGLVTSLENSNRGFTWMWDERGLSNKLIGIIFRNEEWEFNGKSGWSVRPFRACSVATVLDGAYTLPDDKPLKNKAPVGYAASTSAFSTDFADDDDELPF